MQPDTPSQQPKRSPEVARPSSVAPETSSQKLPELTPAASSAAERQPAAVVNPVADLATPSKPQKAASPPAQSQKNDSAQPAASLSAADEDVIEKEWVERAENIIKTKANDPYHEEEDEEALSREYLKQRFNIDVNDS